MEDSGRTEAAEEHVAKSATEALLSPELKSQTEQTSTSSPTSEEHSAPATLTSPAPLNAEQREQIRKDLREKQNTARTSASLPTLTLSPSQNPIQPAESTSTPPPPPPPEPNREQLLAAAVSFLSSPNVRFAPREKQLEFLRRKGLSEDNISVALKQAGLTEDGAKSPPTDSKTTPLPASHVSSARPAQLPAQPAAVYPHQTYPPVAQTALTKTSTLWKDLAVGVILAGGFLPVIFAVFKRFILGHVSYFRRFYKTQLEEREKAVTAFLKRVYAFCKLYQHPASENNDLPSPKNDATVPTLINKTTNDVSTSLSSLQSELATHLARRKPNPTPNTPSPKRLELISQLRASVSDLTRYVTEEVYFTPSTLALYSNNEYGGFGGRIGDDVGGTNGKWLKAVNDAKSEIRTLKGMVISRRG
ncbi:hypothetical protein HDV00_006941 [Rhizophlyctis rosea]|nr:hypothetical protein HDV00_006941 [Rhizophlyctis rosea]